jgi:Flp pilus assembly pilin Flp
MSRGVEYAMVLVIGAMIAIWIATSVGNAISASLNSTAELIANAN